MTQLLEEKAAEAEEVICLLAQTEAHVVITRDPLCQEIITSAAAAARACQRAEANQRFKSKSKPSSSSEPVPAFGTSVPDQQLQPPPPLGQSSATFSFGFGTPATVGEEGSSFQCAVIAGTRRSCGWCVKLDVLFCARGCLSEGGATRCDRRIQTELQALKLDVYPCARKYLSEGGAMRCDCRNQMELRVVCQA